MHQVRYFLAAAEELNFTRAAEKCGVAQPTMTRAIKLLEHSLGGPLFNRERSRTHLTELGRLVLPCLKEIWQSASEARRRAKGLKFSDRAALKVGLMCTIAPFNLMELVRNIRLHQPGIELQMVDAPASSLSEQLTSGALEVAILCQPDGLPEKHNGVALYRERFVIAVSPDNPLAERDVIRVRDLDGADYLDRINCEYGDFAARIFQQQGVSDRAVYQSDRDDWILAMAAAGLGYAFMPEQCARHPGVVVRRLVEPEIWREVCLVTVRGRPYSPALNVMMRETAQLFRRRSTGSSLSEGDDDGVADD